MISTKYYLLCIKVPPQRDIVQDNIVKDVFTVLSDSKSIAITVILTQTNESLLQVNDSVITKMPVLLNTICQC